MYEISYNAACHFVHLHNWAEKLLARAKTVCEQHAKDEGYTQQEILEDLAPVSAQLGFF